MNMPTTAMILAGGKGTRLQSMVSDVPKPLAPVGGRPFLAWQLDHLASQGIRQVILSTGYLADAFHQQIGSSWKGMDIVHVTENEPLGTGGAMRLASREVREELCWVLNGDTYTDFELSALYDMHKASRARCTMALKQMRQFDRYGTVEIDSQGSIRGFREKCRVEVGLINAGVYLVDPTLLQARPPGQAFSFERDVLEGGESGEGLAGLPVGGHFLDIGVPEDYLQAQTSIPSWANGEMPLETPGPDAGWTLFLDRDGVINKRIPDDYVRHPDQFDWLPGVREALKVLRGIFGTIVVVTNQQGIGKGWMTVEDLGQVHLHMASQLDQVGVTLDGLYFCPGLAEDLPVCRKPLPGMALQALQDHPSLDLNRSIMVGDSPSDIAFGNRLGMYTVRIGTEKGEADLLVRDLAAFAAWCSS